MKGTPLMAEAEGKAEGKAGDSGNANHWANFLDCVKTRQKPIRTLKSATGRPLLACWGMSLIAAN